MEHYVGLGEEKVNRGGKKLLNEKLYDLYTPLYIYYKFKTKGL